MRIDVLTLFPDWLAGLVNVGVVGRALAGGAATLRCWNPRDYASDERGTVDDRPFGGGPGMVMTIPPLADALQAVRADAAGPTHVVYLSPQGRVLEDQTVRRLANRSAVTLVCGRYEGVDQRWLDKEVDEEVSIGDYVLSGGELAAAVVIDAIVRLLPGALGKAESAEDDSFANGLLDWPHYTRPEKSRRYGDVPPVLLSGDHGAVAQWRRRQALGRTWRRRSDRLARAGLSDDDRRLLADYIREQRTEKE